jgi:SAM-dependent methyltransferase
VSLASYYRRQYGWRDWPAVFAALPSLEGQTVLDLACGVGDQAAELVARGARVVGLDVNEELLGAARSRGLANAEFHTADLCAPLELDSPADGIWSSFAAAYFPDLSVVLEGWRRALRPRGWIALTEIDDLFGHEPLGARTRELLVGYAGEALAAGRYDFHMGRKLEGHLTRAGFTVSRELALADQELSFTGPARPEVIEAWRARLEGMRLLCDFCGRDFEQVRDDFLGCLARADHRSTARVVCCIAAQAPQPGSSITDDR